MSVSSPVPESEILHATTVAHAGHALVITGAAGAGKSALALDLISRGATLVADDRTRLWVKGKALIAGGIASIEGLIEARGIGILYAPAAPPTPVAAVIDLNLPLEAERLPTSRCINLIGIPLPLYGPIPGAHLAPALMMLLAHGRYA